MKFKTIDHKGEPNGPTIFRGFTATWLSWARGETTKAELQYGYFLFNCAKEHVLVDSEEVAPTEVTWAHEDLKTHVNTPEDGGHTVPMSDIEPKAKKQWLTFRRLMGNAFKEGRIFIQAAR